MSARAIRRALVAAVVVTAAAAPAALPARAHAAPPPGAAAHSFLTVMTRNMDEGTDFKYLIAAAKGKMSFDDAVTATYLEVLASNPCGRAAAIADEIATAQPDFVSLQEAAKWTGPLPTGCAAAATPTSIDAEAALLARLAADGARYTVVDQLDEFSSSVISGLLPPGLSFLDRDVLLARVEPAGQLTVDNVQAEHFSNLFALSLGPLSIPIVRGWISADATVRGRDARVVATHLESFDGATQLAQAEELASGPADTGMPVILAGDLNTGPGADLTASYAFLTAPVSADGGGFTDTWAVTQPGVPGFTDSFYTEDPTVPATPSERIDLVLVRNIDLPSAPKDYLVGTEIPHPSDHAGVVAKVRFQ